MLWRISITETLGGRSKCPFSIEVVILCNNKHNEQKRQFYIKLHAWILSSAEKITANNILFLKKKQILLFCLDTSTLLLYNYVALYFTCVHAHLYIMCELEVIIVSHLYIMNINQLLFIILKHFISYCQCNLPPITANLKATKQMNTKRMLL